MSPLTGVLGESWQLYRRYARHLLTIAFIVFVIAAVLSAGLALVGGILGALLSWLVTLIAEFLLTAALVKAVQDVRDGRVDLSVEQTFRAALPLIGSVAVAAILAGIAITVGLAIFIIPGLFLLTIWCLIMPAIVVGGTDPLASFGRSWQLVRGHFWNVFGILFMVFVIWLAVNLVLGVAFSLLPYFLAHFLSSVIGSTLIAPFIAVVTTLMYFRLSAGVNMTAPGGPYGSPGTYGSQGPY
jgi:hypothetical protein